MSLDFHLFYEVEPGKVVDVFDCNITHNVGLMADKSGVYKALWRPEETNRHRAGEIVGELRLGVSLLEGCRDHFDQFNPPNGWGNRESLIRFCREALTACKEYPRAIIAVSR